MQDNIFLAFLFIDFILLIFSIYEKDWIIQIIFLPIVFILSLSLTIQGLNVQSIAFDGTNFITYQWTDYYLTFGIPFIFSVIATLFGIMVIMLKPWKQTTQGLKLPQGFENFKGIGKV